MTFSWSSQIIQDGAWFFIWYPIIVGEKPDLEDMILVLWIKLFQRSRSGLVLIYNLVLALMLIIIENEAFKEYDFVFYHLLNWLRALVTFSKAKMAVGSLTEPCILALD